MREVIENTICDRCGKKFEADGNHIFIKPKDFWGPTMMIKVLTNEWQSVDICPDCTSAFLNFWYEGEKGVE